jgi:hypothetical protein
MRMPLITTEQLVEKMKALRVAEVLESGIGGCKESWVVGEGRSEGINECFEGRAHHRPDDLPCASSFAKGLRARNRSLWRQPHIDQGW